MTYFIDRAEFEGLANPGEIFGDKGTIPIPKFSVYEWEGNAIKIHTGFGRHHNLKPYIMKFLDENSAQKAWDKIIFRAKVIDNE